MNRNIDQLPIDIIGGEKLVNIPPTTGNQGSHEIRWIEAQDQLPSAYSRLQSLDSMIVRSIHHHDISS
jgi:hypothetical protein